MREYEEQKFLSKKKILIKLTCDLCGKTAIDEEDWDDPDFEYQKTTISIDEHNENFGDITGQKIIIDLCPDCFKNKFIAWLKENGAKIKQTEYYI